MIPALLFDLDGTVVDTDHLHLAAFNAILGAQGVALDRAAYARRVMGRANRDISLRIHPPASALGAGPACQ